MNMTAWVDWIFVYREGRWPRVGRALAYLAMLLFGLKQWNVFASGGEFSFDFLDWAEVTGPRFAMLQDAANRLVFPLHAANPSGLRNATDRFLAIADTPLSPQFLLLRVQDFGHFFFTNLVLMYIIGFIGLVFIARRYKLAPAAFAGLFLVFSFNGHVVNHLAVGHANWAATFLASFVVYYLLQLMEGERLWGPLLGFSGWTTILLLQGHFHLYVWILLLVGFWLVFYPRDYKRALLAGLTSGLAGAIRLLPPVLVVGNMDNEYLGGFPAVWDMLRALVEYADPVRAAFLPKSFVNNLNWWELNTFVGLLGLAFLVIFGVIYTARRDRDSGRMKLLLAGLGVAVLSIGQVYQYVMKIPFPLLAGERVTSRMLLLPVLALAVLAAIQAQRWLQSRALSPRWMVVAGVLIWLEVMDLKQQLALLRIRYLDGMVELFPKVPFDPARHGLANHADPQYVGLIIGGAALSVLTLAALGVLAWRERRQARAKTGLAQ